MPFAALVLGTVSVLVVGLALNMVAVLSSLENQVLDRALLMRGDLSELIVYGPVWRLRS